MPIISLIICVALLSWVATFLLRRFPLPILDHPNHRSLHDRPIPRTGGLAISFSLVIAAGVAAWLELVGRELLLSLLAPWLLLLVVSFLDDIRHVPPLGRMACHLLAAALLVSVVFPGGIAVAMILMLLVAWAINLFNFMDGMDGLAGAMAVIGSGTLAGMAWLGGDPALALLAAILGAAVAGFLAWNLPPARIFLGDAGSVPVGFLLAALAILGAARGSVSPPLAALPFLPFIIDASVTLLWRLIRRQRFWEAHRQHAYQRLVLRGIPVWQVLVVESLLMVGGGVIAIALVLSGASEFANWVAFSVSVIFCLVICFLVGRHQN